MSFGLAKQLAGMGIRDARVLRAIEQLPRQLFVPEPLRSSAEFDAPLPIGFGQTISQPYIVAFMTEALELDGQERVLEVGTGSGYQTALLAALAGEVYSIEIIPELAARAAEVLLETLHLEGIRLRVGDGRLGWPEAAPFDRILVTAAPALVPEALLAQLAPEGRMILPVGPEVERQKLQLIRRDAGGAIHAYDLLPVRFVPLLGAGAGDRLA